MQSDKPFVEYHGVGDDGAGHAVGLQNPGHSQQPRYTGYDVGLGLCELFEDGGGAVYALFERVSRLVHRALGYG